MAAGERTIRREHLPDDFLDDLGAEPVAVVSAPPTAVPAQAAPAVVAPQPAATVPDSARRSLDDIEIDAIRRTLDAVSGNISEAAKRLGISRNTIYRKLRWNGPDTHPRSG